MFLVVVIICIVRIEFAHINFIVHIEIVPIVVIVIVNVIVHIVVIVPIIVVVIPIKAEARFIPLCRV